MTSSAPTSLAEDLPDPSGRRSGPRWGLWAGVGAAVAVVYLGLVAGTGDGLPRGTTAAGVEVGGMSETEAVATLTQALGAQAKAPIPATVNGDPVSIAPDSAGLSFDAEATIARPVRSDLEPAHPALAVHRRPGPRPRRRRRPRASTRP